MNHFMTDISIKCPHCGVKHIYSMKSPYRPFCSKRCKLIDLGAWAQEDYSISKALTEALTKEETEELEKLLGENPKD